jgi:hypothetical protein
VSTIPRTRRSWEQNQFRGTGMSSPVPTVADLAAAIRERTGGYAYQGNSLSWLDLDGDATPREIADALQRIIGTRSPESAALVRVYRSMRAREDSSGRRKARRAGIIAPYRPLAESLAMYARLKAAGCRPDEICREMGIAERTCLKYGALLRARQEAA